MVWAYIVRPPLCHTRREELCVCVLVSGLPPCGVHNIGATMHVYTSVVDAQLVAYHAPYITHISVGPGITQNVHVRPWWHHTHGITHTTHSRVLEVGRCMCKAKLCCSKACFIHTSLVCYNRVAGWCHVQCIFVMETHPGMVRVDCWCARQLW